MTDHHCTPPSVTAQRWQCETCGQEWVPHDHGWVTVPEFVPMTAGAGVVSIRVNDGHPVHGDRE